MNLATAYWCVLIAALPYAWVVVAKASGERYDHRDPRGWIARQTNLRVHRANAAQLNSYEAFAPSYGRRRTAQQQGDAIRGDASQLGDYNARCEGYLSGRPPGKCPLRRPVAPRPRTGPRHR